MYPEDYQQGMQEQQPYPIPQPFMGHTTEGALQFQIDVNDILEEIEHNLKGEVLLTIDNQTRWRVPEGIHPIVNQKGVNSILTILRSRLTKIFILSDLDKDAIERITISIGQNVIDDLYYNWDTYEIRDDASASLILGLVTDTVYATLRKAYMGNYLKFLRTTQSIQEVQHRAIQAREAPQMNMQAEANIFKRLFGRKRR